MKDISLVQAAQTDAKKEGAPRLAKDDVV